MVHSDLPIIKARVMAGGKKERGTEVGWDLGM